MRSSAATLRALWGVLIASILIPSALFALFIWQSRAQALQEAETTAERTVLTIQRHAQNVFDTFRITMDRVEDRIGSLSPQELESSQEIHEFLKRVAEHLPQVSAIILVDAQGRRINSSTDFSSQSRLDLSDRDYIKAFRMGHRGLFVGETIQGRRTGQVQFIVARPLSAPQGVFTGAIVISAPPSYFADFYRQTAPRMNHSAALVRADGVFLVRDAEARPSTEQPRASENFMRAVSKGLTETRWIGISAVDGVQRVTAMRKLDGDLPVYALFALGTDAILAGWREQIIHVSLFAVPAILGLIFLSAVALARTRRQQAATAQLRAEMERREQAEAKLVQAQKLEALGSLTAGIAHDFNNILQVVIGNLDMLKRAAEERRPRLIDNALRAAEQGRKITGQLLAFGRRQTLNPEVTDLNELLLGMDDMIAQSLRGDIKLKLDLARGLWPVELDRSQLQVALINLAANARDAMPGGGVMKVRTENKVLGDGSQTVALSVTDTGVGMASETLKRLGEPFFSTKKEAGRGNGLGLAQVFGFVHQSGGTVDVRSEVGQGTTVTLLLPRTLKGSKSRAGVAAAPARPALSGLRLLVVDDNPEVAEVASGMLAAEGHTIRQAESAREALTLLNRGERFDLVISDLVMPGEIDGFGLAKTIRERSPSLPVLLVTGYSEAASQASREGFPLLTKPFSAQDLSDKIGRLMSGRA